MFKKHTLRTEDLIEDNFGRDRKCHLDVGESVSIHPITGETVDVLLPRQSQVVIPTAGYVLCHDESREQMRT